MKSTRIFFYLIEQKKLEVLFILKVQKNILQKDFDSEFPSYKHPIAIIWKLWNQRFGVKYCDNYVYVYRLTQLSEDYLTIVGKLTKWSDEHLLYGGQA